MCVDVADLGKDSHVLLSLVGYGSDGSLSVCWTTYREAMEFS